MYFDRLLFEMEYGSHLQVAFCHPEGLLYVPEVVILVDDRPIAHGRFKVGVVAFDAKQAGMFLDKVGVEL